MWPWCRGNGRALLLRGPADDLEGSAIDVVLGGPLKTITTDDNPWDFGGQYNWYRVADQASQTAKDLLADPNGEGMAVDSQFNLLEDNKGRPIPIIYPDLATKTGMTDGYYEVRVFGLRFWPPD